MNGSSCCSPSVGRMARTSWAVRSHRTVVSGRVIVVSRLVVVTRHASFVVGGRFRRVIPKREEDSSMPPDDDREGEAWLSGFASAPHKEILFFDEMFA